MSDSRYTYTATEEGQPLTEPDRGDRGCQRVTKRKTKPRNFIVNIIQSWPALIRNLNHFLFTSANV